MPSSPEIQEGAPPVPPKPVVPPPAPETIVPASSVTIIDFLKSKNVTLEPQRAADFKALNIVLPLPTGWSQVPDPNVPDASQTTVEAGATIPEVQAALGHTSIASTGIYTAVGDREGAAAMARAEQRQSDREQDVSVDSLGGVSAIEALRRVLRQLEHQEGKKKKPRKR